MLARLRAQPRAARLLEALAGVEGAYLVGGAVRDLLRSGEPLDLDVVVEGDSAEAARRAATNLGGVVTVHDRFGTATVTAPEVTFDLATARRERYPRPGALPEVEAAPLDEDLRRRDFTVNAIALALDGPEPGAVRAPPGAREDLDAGRLRVLHDASFLDDPTRLLRLVRYAARLRFAIEPATEELARSAVAARALTTVSGARVGDELRLLLRERDPDAALGLAAQLGLDRALHPALAPDAPAAEAARGLLPADGRADLVTLAAACRAFDPAALGEWLDELEFPAAEREVVVAAALDAESVARQLAEAGSPSEIAAAARGRPPEAVALAGALDPDAASAARRWLEDLRHIELEIDGADVLAAGVAEGPDVGRALAAALSAKLDGAAAGRDQELAAALAAIGRQ